MKLIFQPWLVEKGDVQHASVVHGPDLHQIHALSDVGQLWLCGDHSGNAGRLTGDQLTDGLRFPAVLIAVGKPCNEISQRGNAQLAQRFGLGLAYALNIPHVRIEIRHGRPPPACLFSILLCYYKRFRRV